MLQALNVEVGVLRKLEHCNYDRDLAISSESQHKWLGRYDRDSAEGALSV